MTTSGGREEDCWCGSSQKHADCHFPHAGLLVGIAGAPCVGKSTLAEVLNQAIKTPASFRFDWDGLWQAATNALIRQQPEIEQREAMSRARLRLMSELPKMAMGKCIVADLMLETAVIRTIREACKLNEVWPFLVLLECAPDERRRRDEERHHRNPGAPHGFTDSLVPTRDDDVYDLCIDTSSLSTDEVLERVQVDLTRVRAAAF
jgi:chloramphenicol 3-O-phosphotransferase